MIVRFRIVVIIRNVVMVIMVMIIVIMVIVIVIIVVVIVVSLLSVIMVMMIVRIIFSLNEMVQALRVIVAQAVGVVGINMHIYQRNPIFMEQSVAHRFGNGVTFDHI